MYFMIKLHNLEKRTAKKNKQKKQKKSYTLTTYQFTHLGIDERKSLISAILSLETHPPLKLLLRLSHMCSLGVAYYGLVNVQKHPGRDLQFRGLEDVQLTVAERRGSSDFFWS